MKSGIYLISNTADGKYYVGSSKKPQGRWRKHLSFLRLDKHTNPHLQRAWNRDGESSFHFAILEYCAVEQLEEREDWWIELLSSRDPRRGYNLWSARRHECSLETRAKLSAATLNRSPEEKARIAQSKREKMMGKQNSKGVKQKPRTPEHCANISKSQLGKSRSEATREKIRQAKIGNKCALGHDGRWGSHTAEAKAKISAARMGNQNIVAYNERRRAEKERKMNER